MAEKRQRVAFTLRLCACTSGIKLISPFGDGAVAGGEVRDYVSVMWCHTHAVTRAEDGICTRSVCQFTDTRARASTLLLISDSSLLLVPVAVLLLWNHRDYEQA